MRSNNLLKPIDNTKEQNIFFESKLAISLALRPDLLLVVAKVSSQIIKLMKKESEKIKEILSNEINFKNLKNELYREIDKGPLGAITKPISEITVDSMLHDIELVLTDPNANLITIMPIHSVFGYRIAQQLYKKDYQDIKSSFKSAAELIETTKKYVKKKAEDKDIVPTSQLGLSDVPEVCKKINNLTETKKLIQMINPIHRNSRQRYSIDETADYFQEQNNNHLPVAAGPSSHTINLFTAAKLYEKILQESELCAQELMEYALAYFSYFGTAGYHSFHEVMKIASLCSGAPYQAYSYKVNLPKQVNDFLLTADKNSKSDQVHSVVSQSQTHTSFFKFKQHETGLEEQKCLEEKANNKVFMH